MQCERICNIQCEWICYMQCEWICNMQRERICNMQLRFQSLIAVQILGLLIKNECSGKLLDLYIGSTCRSTTWVNM